MAVPVWNSHIAVAVASTSIGDLRKCQQVVLVL